MSTVIELMDIGKRFGSFDAVKGLNLQIEDGELISLLGPSGCGKTTTLRMIAGFETPTSGSILLYGKDINHVPVRLRNLTMVFQNYALFPHMDVYDNIAFGLNMRKTEKSMIREKVEKLLSIVKLEGFEKRLPSQLSGGQQQRVALARALITEPDVLLLDEPFGALDKKLRESMQLEIRNILKNLGITAIFVTHDQEEALVLSDRIVIMNSGAIEQVGTPKQTYEYPRTKFVADFIGVSNIFEGDVHLTEDGNRYLDWNGVKLYFEGGQDREKQALAIRPEWVELYSENLEKENSIHGEIADVKYFGNNVQYFIYTGADKPVIASNPNTDSFGAYRRGDRVTIVCRKSALRALMP